MIYINGDLPSFAASRTLSRDESRYMTKDFGAPWQEDDNNDATFETGMIAGARGDPMKTRRIMRRHVMPPLGGRACSASGATVVGSRSMWRWGEPQVEVEGAVLAAFSSILDFGIPAHTTVMNTRLALTCRSSVNRLRVQDRIGSEPRHCHQKEHRCSTTALTESLLGKEQMQKVVWCALA
ncbi:MAG TPA: hypothetical protein VHK24_14775 [Steroidobacter sp.]|nr:hypothetical protein [Steroidobacter sp.]